MAAREEEKPSGARQHADPHLPWRVSMMINWKKPFRTSAFFIATNIVFWFVFLGSCQVLSLISMCLVFLVMMQLIKKVCFSRLRGATLWTSMTSSWEVIDSVHEEKSDSGFSFTNSWMSLNIFIKETSSFKQQNPGKFCLLVCSMCCFLAILGRYIPGVVISYIIVLGVFLWPLVSSQEFWIWLEPVLQRLDFGLGEFFQRIKENQDNRMLQTEAEKESIEADLSSLFPKLDSTVCKELSVSDTEVSDITWTDNGTFNLSEGHTPQTESLEDSDPRSDEDVFTSGLPEFSSLDNVLGTNSEDEEDLSIRLPTLPAPSEFGETERGLEVLQRLAGDAIADAVTSAVQESLEAAVASSLVQALAEESDSEAEDFELLDQSELEQLEGELGLDREGHANPSKPSKPSGFLSKLLGRR